VVARSRARPGRIAAGAGLVPLPQLSHAAGDPYLDPASGVLRNLPGITDAAELARAEAAPSASQLIDLERQRLPGRYDVDHHRATPLASTGPMAAVITLGLARTGMQTEDS
jgi:hypothetical protein